jgi:hypothetical protein
MPHCDTHHAEIALPSGVPLAASGGLRDNAAAESFFAALKKKCTIDTVSLPEPARDSQSPNKSKASITVNGCIFSLGDRPSAEALADYQTQTAA